MKWAQTSRIVVFLFSRTRLKKKELEKETCYLNYYFLLLDLEKIDDRANFVFWKAFFEEESFSRIKIKLDLEFRMINTRNR